MTQTTALAKSDALEQALIAVQDQIAGVLPRHMTPERMIRLAVHAFAKTPALQQCSRESLVAAVIEASEVGLEPVGVMGEAALVPYKGVVQFQPMYKGLVKLVRQSGEVSDVHADVVHQRDEFDYYHATPQDHLFHRPAIGNRGPIVGAWARATMKDSSQKVLFYDLEKIERIRNMSKQPDGMMWGKHYDEAAKKTVIKALCKTLPVSLQAARAIDIDNRDTDIQPAPQMTMPRRRSEIAATPEQTNSAPGPHPFSPGSEAPPPPTSPTDGNTDKYAAAQPPKCEKCKVDCVYREAGISKTGKNKGKPHSAFWSCPNFKECKFIPVWAKEWYEQQQAGKKEATGSPTMSAEDGAKVDELYTNLVKSSQRSPEALSGYLSTVLYGSYGVKIKEEDWPKVLTFLEALTAKVPTEQSQILAEYEPGAPEGLPF